MADLRDEEVKAVSPKTDENQTEEMREEESQAVAEQEEESAAAGKEETSDNNNVGDDSDDDLEPVDLDSDRHGSSRNKSRSAEGRERKKRVRKNRGRTAQNAATSEDSKGSKEASEETEAAPARTKKEMDPYKKKRIKKRIRTLIILLIIVGLILLGYYRFIVPAREQAEALLSQMTQQTEPIERRNVTDCITTTGTVQSNKTVDLSVGVPQDGIRSTTVEEVHVAVGDTVKAGDVMFVFSTYNTLDENIDYLKGTLSEQRQKDSIRAQSTERNYYFVYSNQATGLQNAADNVDSALKTLYEACDGYGSAKRELQKAIDEGASELAISNLKSAVNSAYEAEQRARDNYEKAVRAQAQAVTTTNNTLTEADENHQLSIISNNDTSREYKHQIENMEKQKDLSIVYAPFDGLITSVNAVEGNVASGVSICTIQDVSKMQITAQIDEYDVAKIQLGQYVAIRSDPLNDAEMDGVVTYIAPTSTITKSSSSTEAASVSTAATSNPTYEIKIDIVNPDARLKLGMTAKLSIVTAEVNGVLTVPFDAISTDSEGKTYITVVDEASAGSGPVLQVNGQNAATPEQKPEKKEEKPSFFGGKSTAEAEPEVKTKDIYVEVGMEGDYYSEITSPELKEGMTVVIPQSEEDNPFLLMMQQMNR